MSRRFKKPKPCRRRDDETFEVRLNMDHPMNFLAMTLEPAISEELMDRASEDESEADGSIDIHRWFKRFRELADPHLTEEQKNKVDKLAKEWLWDSLVQ